MEKTLIDWSSLSAEDILKAINVAPRVASVWQYSEVTQGYNRHLLWHPKKGSQLTWLDVGSVWASGANVEQWWGFANLGESNEQKFGPFHDRFQAADAVDNALELDGWKLCR